MKTGVFRSSALLLAMLSGLGAQAATLTLDQVVDHTAAMGSYSFDIADLIADEAALGNVVQVTGATLSLDGHSRFTIEPTQTTLVRSYPFGFNCAFGGCFNVEEYRRFMGDRTVETARVDTSTRNYLYQTTYNSSIGYYDDPTFYEISAPGPNVYGLYHQFEDFSYAHFGVVEDSTALIQSDLVLLEGGNALELTLDLTGAFTRMSLQLSVDYDTMPIPAQLGTVPLPSAGWLLLAAVGFGALRRRR